MKMRKLLALLLALIMSMSLVACGGSDDEAAADDGDAAVEETADTLVAYSSGAFQGAWDPTKNSILSNKHLEYQVMDCLLNYDAESNLTPNIAKSWEYLEDGYTLRIYLNEGVKFHDGSELTAEDVVATMVYMTRPDSSLRKERQRPPAGQCQDGARPRGQPPGSPTPPTWLRCLLPLPRSESAEVPAGALPPSCQHRPPSPASRLPRPRLPVPLCTRSFPFSLVLSCPTSSCSSSSLRPQLRFAPPLAWPSFQ